MKKLIISSAVVLAIAIGITGYAFATNNNAPERNSVNKSTQPIESSEEEPAALIGEGSVEQAPELPKDMPVENQPQSSTPKAEEAVAPETPKEPAAITCDPQSIAEWEDYAKNHAPEKIESVRKVKLSCGYRDTSRYEGM